MDEYILVERLATVGEYQRLRESAGWICQDSRSTEIGLHNSLFSVCVTYRDKVIGHGRVVGDGGIYFYIQDVIVLPEFQGKGIGRRIMNAIMDYLKTNARHNAFIGLMAAKGVSEFYEQFDFKKRPDDSPGMLKIGE
ncbi:MAG: GNAT family N-acetyltransferase [Methanosarcinales archaeon]|nr:GNAT family N-acetyltransferase [ANME-2 cluster archaeon]MDW7775253.1 GNAT family N-acetyltransferase [Methanosarcinales archaeon]